MAAAFQMWGLEVRSAELLSVAVVAPAEGTKAHIEGLDISDFELATFLGWPDHEVLKNIVGAS